MAENGFGTGTSKRDSEKSGLIPYPEKVRPLTHFWILFLVAILGGVLPTPAWAMKDRTIVLRATGSGALIGLGAGLISYPFAQSTNTIFAGAFVGAVLGTLYGFHLLDNRDEAYRRSEWSTVRPLFAQVPDTRGTHLFAPKAPIFSISVSPWVFDLR